MVANKNLFDAIAKVAPAIIASYSGFNIAPITRAAEQLEHELTINYPTDIRPMHLVQYRVPRSKKRRIRLKWANNPLNYKWTEKEKLSWRELTLLSSEMAGRPMDKYMKFPNRTAQPMPGMVIGEYED